MPRSLYATALLLLLVAIPSPLFAASPITHTVAWGETLYSIARVHALPPQAIATANGIGLNTWVYAGQRLTIPSSGNPAPTVSNLTPSGYYTVRAGDTMFSIATRYGLTVQTLAAANNLPPTGLIYVGWNLKIPAASANAPAPANAPSRGSQTYIVQQGEYLARIALRFGTSVQAIVLANSLPNAWLVYAGQRLVIPGAQTGAAPPPASAPAASATLNVRVANVPLYKQQHTLTCEEASVAMASRGTISEARLLAVMPRSDNPFAGIRGKLDGLNGGLTDYGTYAQGIQKGLAALGVSSQVLYGQGYDAFRAAVIAHLQMGHPVVWWQTWRDTYQTPVTVKASDGTWVKLVPYEHTSVIVAANDKGATYNDPYDATVHFVSWGDFARVSAYFNNMALVIQ